MSKYRVRYSVVDAVQWQPGSSVDGVVTRPSTIRYSITKDLYYIEKGDLWPRNWLSVKKTPGEPPERMKNTVIGGAIMITKKDNSEIYHREVFPFAFFSVKTGPQEDADEDSDLFKDYALLEEWGEAAFLPAQSGWMRVGEETKKVVAGDWIITHEDGNKSICKPDKFEALFEPVNDPA